MEIHISDTTVLTTKHAQSSYNIPVLVINDNAYGPSDHNAGEIVYSWAKQPERTQSEIMAAKRFLMQNPNNQQL